MVLVGRLCLVVLGTSTACAFQMPLGGQRQATVPSKMPQLHLQRLRSPYEATVLRWRGGKAPTMLIPAVEPAVLSSSLQAVTELLTCCGLGVLATRVGLLDAATTRSLAKCVFNIFLPAMLFTSVSRTVASGASLSSLLPMPLAALLQIGLGLILVTVLLGGPKEVKTAAGRDVAALSSFGNSGVLPLVFANCLFRAQPVLLARANSLVAMFLLGWSPLFWTLGYGLLAGKRDGSSGDGPSSADEDSYWTGLRKRVLTPPIVGCLSGILVGALPPLRTLLVPPAGGGAALLPLPLHRCLEAFGKACEHRSVLNKLPSLPPRVSLP